MRRWLTPLARGFGCAVKIREQLYHRGWIRPGRLERPVISVGNLTVGGTGKTPVVIFIAEWLLKNELRPAILTRGYGRSTQVPLVIEPGAPRAVDPRHVGDEPALMARKLPTVPILVSRDRCRAGREAEKRFGVDVHILDDGFQHWRLARDLDLVLLDSTQALAEEALVPAGRLREPLAALRRADALMLTRAELANPQANEMLVRAVNPRPPVFHSTTELTHLVDMRTGEFHAPCRFQNKPVMVFAGLGNPQGFFQAVRRWGFNVVGEKAFADHHRYSPGELMEMARQARARGAEACLTTEKDGMNFPRGLAAAISPPLLECAIRVQVNEAAAFEAMLGRALHHREEKNA